MGKKYSINAQGYMVAERDIHPPFGSFTPKGSVGAKVADENQVSQDGECWVETGDLSKWGNKLRIKDNAFIRRWGYQTGDNTDVAVEISGSSVLLSGNCVVGNSAIPNQSILINNTEINVVSALALFGQSYAGRQFFVQGGIDVSGATKGSSLSSMFTTSTKACRSAVSELISSDTEIVNIPTNSVINVYYIYADETGGLVYSGESISSGGRASLKLKHPEYARCMITVSNEIPVGDLLIADLSARNIYLKNRVEDPVCYISPEMYSETVVVSDSVIKIQVPTPTQAATMCLNGSVVDCPDVTMIETTIINRKLYGVFSNIKQLILDPIERVLGPDINPLGKYLVRVYGCPLFRLDVNTSKGIPLSEKDGLVIRRCTVPKAEFRNNITDGNTYEDIDFSYASEYAAMNILGGNYRTAASHVQGMYDLRVGSFTSGPVGRISTPDNLSATATLRPKSDLYVYNFAQIPVVSGSGRVGPNVALRGDVKVIGAEYKCRVLSHDMFEYGSVDVTKGVYWEPSKISLVKGNPRLRTVNIIPCKKGDKIICGSGYWFYPTFFDENGIYVTTTGWINNVTITDEKIRYLGCICKKGANMEVTGEYLDTSDVEAMGLTITYAFPQKHYVTNVLDIQKLPDGTLDPSYEVLGEDDFEQGYINAGASSVGNTYKYIKVPGGDSIVTKKPLNISGVGLPISVASTFRHGTANLDAGTLFNNAITIEAMRGLSIAKYPVAPTTVADLKDARLVIDYVPTPRIASSYNGAAFSVEGPLEVRDNAVWQGYYKNDNSMKTVLRDDAVYKADINCQCISAWDESQVIQ